MGKRGLLGALERSRQRDSDILCARLDGHTNKPCKLKHDRACCGICVGVFGLIARNAECGGELHFDRCDSGYRIGCMGVMVMMGRKLGFMESICVTVIVGLAVDYVVHYGIAFVAFQDEFKFAAVGFPGSDSESSC